MSASAAHLLVLIGAVVVAGLAGWRATWSP